MDRRGFVRAAVAAPLAAGALLRPGRAAAAAPGAQTVARMAQAPFLYGLAVPQSAMAVHLPARERQLGRAADVVLVFARISEQPSDLVASLMDAGYEVALCLEWWDASAGPADPRFSLREIASGAHDEAAVRWFRAFRDLPRPVHLRPLHEANGDWYPWGVFSGVNAVADFVPAFRHVVRLLWDNAGGRARVQWCVNRKNGRERPEPVAALYPGDDWVNELVVNGYNRPEFTRSTPFAEVFEPHYRAVKELSVHKPFWVGETACTERFGDKARWIREMFATVRTSMVVDCITWFDIRKEPPGEPVRDWELDSSPEALAAFRRGLEIHRGVPG